MKCPICGDVVANVRGLASHFRHQADTHPHYATWKADQKWADKVEGVDYVRCRECEHRGASLARHLKAAHGFSADEYRTRHPGALVRPTAVEGRRRAGIKAARRSDAYEGKKIIVCPSCGREHEVHKLSGIIPCPQCKAADEKTCYEDRWEGKSEPDDYVTCAECGYRAENLTSHTQNAHSGYREGHPEALMVALNSAVRDKTALKGLVRPLAFGQAIREAKTLGFTLSDFEPYLEVDGTVDHRRAMKGLACAWPTLKRYMTDLGLEMTTRYLKQRQADRRVVLTKETLEAFKLKNGKVSVGRAVGVLGHHFKTIKRECDRLGLPIFHRRIKQTFCLDAVSKALGGLTYMEEWKSWRFINPPTGYRFKFDGYFPDVGLIVEFQGHQHYTFPNAFLLDESYLPVYEASRERDKIKRELIEAAPDLQFLEVREDEPFKDVSYLKGRLHALGL